jgi:hypothetical protein
VFQDRLNLFSKKSQVLCGGGAARLRLVVSIARPTVGFKSSQSALPQGGRIAIAVDKHHRRFFTPTGEQMARAGTLQEGEKSNKKKVSAQQVHGPRPSM